MHMIEEPMSHTDHEFHRKIAAECFNRTWDYLKQKNRNPDDDQTMLNLAHASRYHWSIIGKPLNFAIGDWQISRAYSALNQPYLAIHFAKTSLQMCRKNNLSGWLLASAYEGMGGPTSRPRIIDRLENTWTRRVCNSEVKSWMRRT